tara:strand:+ start:204 stop:371 length:168 start_codon:yes stop_codon:yes gene_type:complete
MKTVKHIDKGHTFTLTKIDLTKTQGQQTKIKVDSIVRRGSGPLKKNVLGTKPKEG